MFINLKRNRSICAHMHMNISNRFMSSLHCCWAKYIWSSKRRRRTYRKKGKREREEDEKNPNRERMTSIPRRKRRTRIVREINEETELTRRIHDHTLIEEKVTRIEETDVWNPTSGSLFADHSLLKTSSQDTSLTQWSSHRNLNRRERRCLWSSSAVA